MTGVKSSWQQDILEVGVAPTRKSTVLRRHGGKVALGFLLFAALGGGALYALRPHGAVAVKALAAPTSALTVTVVPAKMGLIPRSLMVTGSLAARDELPIGTETSGLALSAVLVEVGDQVKQGQLLARFNDSVLRAQTQQAQAALVEAEANEVEAANNSRRAEELAKAGWISGKDFDNRRALALGMSARVGVAKANLAFAEAKLKQAELRAPTGGTITSRSAHLGEVTVGTEMFRMIRDDRVELIAELPENELAGIKPGQKTTLTIAGSSQNAEGAVRLVEPTVDVKTRIGRVRIDVDQAANLRPGMFVTGQILLDQSDALVAPEKAIVYLDGKPIVFVVDAGGTVTQRPVSLGPRAAGMIAVQSGVQPGERLVLRGAAYLKNGDQVTVVEGGLEPESPPSPHSL
jgi:RND family efflux transporter MFP subunit